TRSAASFLGAVPARISASASPSLAGKLPLLPGVGIPVRYHRRSEPPSCPLAPAFLATVAPTNQTRSAGRCSPTAAIPLPLVAFLPRFLALPLLPILPP